jgi:DNA-binding beta-propeller fold protein YncE
MRTALVVCLAGCTAAAEDVRPPEDQIFFPTGMAIAPDDSVAFIANANSELRYDSGSVIVLDLAVVDQFADNWTANQTIPDHCSQDPDHIETLDCSNDDHTNFMRAGAGARIGNFSTDIAVQNTMNGTLRLIVPTRGDPSVSWIDWSGSTLSCNENGEGFALCDDTHRLTFVHSDPNLVSLPDEPFNAFADATGQYAIVTHLTTGAVTLIDSPIGGNATIADVEVGLFEPDPLTGLRGATGVAGRTPSAAGDIIYVGSRSEGRIQMLTVGHPVNDAAPFLLAGNWFFLDAIGNNAGGSSDTRGMTFGSGGDRLYLVNRNPPALEVIDTSLTSDFPANTGLGGTDICRNASTLAVMNPGDGDHAYVTCFDDGQIYVVDLSGVIQLDDVIPVGRGPYAVVAAPTRKKVYVTNFLEDTVAVIDVTPGSALRNRVVLRIGEPRQ